MSYFHTHVKPCAGALSDGPNGCFTGLPRPTTVVAHTHIILYTNIILYTHTHIIIYKHINIPRAGALPNVEALVSYALPGAGALFDGPDGCYTGLLSLPAVVPPPLLKVPPSAVERRLHAPLSVLAVEVPDFAPGGYVCWFCVCANTHMHARSNAHTHTHTHTHTQVAQWPACWHGCVMLLAPLTTQGLMFPFSTATAEGMCV